MMKTSIGILFSLVALALLGGVGIAAADEAAAPGSQAVTADSIAPYNGPIGPGNSLYGLKIAFENLDESFTFNQSEKLEKQINHTGTRLAELKKELAENRTDGAAIALDEYWHKINQTEESLEQLPLDGNQTRPEVTDTGLQNAENQIARHQQVLEDLMQSHPGNAGLARAYNNSVTLEEKFADKIAEKGEKRRQQQDAGSANDLPGGMNQTMNRSGVSPDGLPDMNQSMNKGGSGHDGLSGMNQTVNKGGSGQDGLPGMNQTMNRSGGPDGQAANQTAQGKHQQSGSGAPANNGQNTNVNNGNSQNQNNANTGNTNTGNRNNNANTNTGTGNNKENTGAANGGNTNANMRGNGR
jgi:hypothetical protein